MTKKLFAFFCMMLVTACLCVTFSSCGDDSDSTSPKVVIIGSWSMHEYYLTTFFTFNTDGSYQIAHKKDGAKPDTKTTDENGCFIKSRGTYAITGNQLQLNQTERFDPEEYRDKEWHKQVFSGGAATMQFSQDGNTLTLIYKDEEGKEEVIVLSKVR